MITNEELYEKIKDYYQRAFCRLRVRDLKEAERILYSEMSREMYDISLNILDQANNKTTLNPKQKKLFDLIDEVDNLLTYQKTKLNRSIEDLSNDNDITTDKEPETNEIIKEERNLDLLTLNIEDDI